MTIALEITTTQQQVRLTCVAVRAMCEQAGMDSCAAYQFELCLDETLINIAEHNFGWEPNHLVRIELDFEKAHVTAHIDYRRYKDWPAESLLEATLPRAADLPERGFGNYLIKHLMDRIAVTHEGNRTRIHLEKWFDKAGSTTADPVSTKQSDR